MDEIIEILMRRDGNTHSEAVARYRECRRRLMDEAVSTGNCEIAEDIIAEELGLEPDYIMALLM